MDNKGKYNKRMNIDGFFCLGISYYTSFRSTYLAKSFRSATGTSLHVMLVLSGRLCSSINSEHGNQ